LGDEIKVFNFLSVPTEWE